MVVSLSTKITITITIITISLLITKVGKRKLTPSGLQFSMPAFCIYLCSLSLSLLFDFERERETEIKTERESFGDQSK